ncbi:hypothetical protein K8O93_00965 [Gordonia bronchialis]|uniref:hypothetical protein n=1 Tax=Gordonia bronchialis TaxID=2054 RepID=UPI001CBDEA84|nr:hypothetical protein [Gordonia bronchialis]UAK38404.1 hypothetical protein K8O93_00965 [Gordonia bronchialis]
MSLTNADDSPSTRRLKEYWAYGEGALKWRGSPRPWTTLNALLAKYVPNKRIRNGLTSNIMMMAGVSWTGEGKDREYTGLGKLKPEHKTALRKARRSS